MIRCFKNGETVHTNLGYHLAVDFTGVGDRLNVGVGTQIGSRVFTEDLMELEKKRAQLQRQAGPYDKQLFVCNTAV